MWRYRVDGPVHPIVFRAVGLLARGLACNMVEPLLTARARTIRERYGAPRGPLPVAQVAAEWQRLTVEPESAVITAIDGDTAYAEIRSHCPLRGSGDLHACHRLRAYDRALVAPMGARFVVLQSQAAPGVSCCRVAMRSLTLPADDLVPIYNRHPSSVPPPPPPPEQDADGPPSSHGCG